ncbi:MAG: LysE family translocator [Bordetella sp.]|nr:LysE family translocator [Bordetella sp.]
MDVSWQQFGVVAGAHFLALLSPGPDFVLIARSSMLRGWRRTLPLCAGIAAANGLFVALAIGGLAVLREGTWAFQALQWAGCAYLVYLGQLFLRHAGPLRLAPEHTAPEGAAPPVRDAARAFGTGLASGLVNPKNALFYASLFALLADRTPAGVQALYGVWMTALVFVWDALVAAALRHPAMVRRYAAHNAAIERVTGVVLLLIGAAAAWLLLRG